MILNSFKYAGFSSSLNKSEDHKFIGYKDLEKWNETKELENDKALVDQEDNYVTNNRSY